MMCKRCLQGKCSACLPYLMRLGTLLHISKRYDKVDKHERRGAVLVTIRDSRCVTRIKHRQALLNAGPAS